VDVKRPSSTKVSRISDRWVFQARWIVGAPRNGPASHEEGYGRRRGSSVRACSRALSRSAMIASRRLLSHPRQVSGPWSGCETPRLIHGSELQRDEALRSSKTTGQNTKRKSLAPKLLQPSGQPLNAWASRGTRLTHCRGTSPGFAIHEGFCSESTQSARRANCITAYNTIEGSKA